MSEENVGFARQSKGSEPINLRGSQMFHRLFAGNLLLIRSLVVAVFLLAPSQGLATPITYELGLGTDLTGHFTYDAASLSLTDYQITSAAHSVTWSAPTISQAFGPNGFFIADHAFLGTTVYLLNFFARVDTLTFQGNACIEPFCSFSVDSRGSLAVPEASTMRLLLLGGMGLLWTHRLIHPRSTAYRWISVD